MNIEEIRAERRQTEAKLAALIAPVLQEFQRKVGFEVEHVSVNLMEATCVEDRCSVFTVSEVSILMERI